MWALDQPCAPRADRLVADTPLALLATLALGVATTGTLVALAVLPPSAVHVAGVTAGHGALLATALARGHRGGALAGRVRASLSRRSAPAEEQRARGRGRLLSGAARRNQLLAPLVVTEPGARTPQRAGLLRGVSNARLRMSLVAALLGAVTALLALDGAGPASLFRHAYLVPVVVAALRFGALGGTIAAAAAVLLSAPFVLPEIERSGLTSEASEGLMTFAVLALVGVLSGALRTRAGRHRRRYEILVAIQRTLADAAALDVALVRVRTALVPRLRMDDLALVARDGDRLVVAGGARVVPGSLVARVLDGGAAAFVGDAGGGCRSRRAFATPLVSGGRAIGVLAVERKGEIAAEERAALEALGAHVGLALENARLASRQRQFAAELAEKISVARRELEELDRAKSAFVAIASHELRTPLTALQGFSELLALRRRPPADGSR